MVLRLRLISHRLSWSDHKMTTIVKHSFIKIFTISEAELVHIHHLNGAQKEAFFVSMKNRDVTKTK